jgi:two-component system cell cycle sensor histidine kinase/response regulator CckA
MILVVDGDRMMRALIDRTLRAQGYQVVLAAGIAEARLLLSGVAPTLDMFLTDVLMPGDMSPELAVGSDATTDRSGWYMSAYAPADLQKWGIDLDCAPLLQKPFMPPQLAEGAGGTGVVECSLYF